MCDVCVCAGRSNPAPALSPRRIAQAEPRSPFEESVKGRRAPGEELGVAALPHSIFVESVRMVVVYVQNGQFGGGSRQSDKGFEGY